MRDESEAERKLNFLLIDDHALFRAGMRYLLQELPYEVCISEASSLGEAIRGLEVQKCDLILLDLIMPDCRPEQLLDEVRAGSNAAPVLVISSSDEPTLIHMALDRGAAGFVPKNSAPNLMLQAISLVLSGGIYIPPAVLKLLQYSRNDNGSAADIAPVANLTERHREVLEHLAKGYSNKQIARALGVSEGTVKAHVAGLFRLLQAQNRTQAILLATEKGLVRPPH